VARDVREETRRSAPSITTRRSPGPSRLISCSAFPRGPLTTEITVDYGELEDARWCERDWLLSHKDGDTFRMPRLDSIAAG
jgi:hypothetical protein